MIRKYKVEICLIFAFIWFLISIYITGTDGSLFSRSGSVMVLLAVIAEFQLSGIKDSSIKTSAVGWSGVPPTTKLELSSRHNMLTIIAHIEVILGTLVWGYGDLAYGYLMGAGT